jgi:alginate O-acetyltransferase complex protein AlgI
MAIGLARMFGFLLENFNMPYVATSITDFWRRWHISLTSRSANIYISRSAAIGGEARTYLNLWICFWLWDLARRGLTYIAWGAIMACSSCSTGYFWSIACSGCRTGSPTSSR